ncbi:MAG: imidazole glycerol phosphate synthase subunit HisH [Alphaproteobacteria bacterium]
MGTVAIVDYGLCNLDSIARAIERCGGSPRVTCDPAALPTADHIILPGVGAFGAAMVNLRASGMDEAIVAEVGRRAVPFLGICLGMQLLAERSSEGDSEGLGLIPGEITRLEPINGERVPHVGWNEVEVRAHHPLFEDIASGTDFYFVHSYRFDASSEYVTAVAPYCGGFIAGVRRGHVLGVQFHPEKSQKAGFRMLENFLGMRWAG